MPHQVMMLPTPSSIAIECIIYHCATRLSFMTVRLLMVTALMAERRLSVS